MSLHILAVLLAALCLPAAARAQAANSYELVRGTTGHGSVVIQGTPGDQCTTPATTKTGDAADCPAISVFRFHTCQRAPFCLGGGPANGSVACTSPDVRAGLPDGIHNLRVSATDPSGHASPSAPCIAWRQETTPTARLLTAPTLTFSAGEPATFTCRVDAGAAAPCASPFTTPALTARPHRIEHPGFVARIIRFAIKRYGDVPVRTTLCQAPGTKRPGRC